jgi:5-methylcytosine-specific restriction endonuclease McrA
LPRQTHDNPYRDESSPRSSSTRGPRSRQAHKAPKTAPPAPRPRQRASEPLEYRDDAGIAAPRRRSARRKRGRRGDGAPELQLTSHPTGRSAYLATRVWLLERHGPVCAYCGKRFTPQVMTLDHVAPRRGQTAYDRRDNLVLACPGCNAAKRDLPPTAYLLGARGRAANLLRYGAHLSPMLLEIARALAPAGAAPVEEPVRSNGHGSNGNGSNGNGSNGNGSNGHGVKRDGANGNARGWAALAELEDGESPYRD